MLDLFAPHAELLHGHDGGLNKTGTMSGVSTLAGYADTSKHGRVRFVISLKSGGPMRFQLLKAIEAGLSAAETLNSAWTKLLARKSRIGWSGVSRRRALYRWMKLSKAK